jgi:hypothetical protein
MARREEEYLATWRSREYALTWEETTEGWIQLDNKELRNLYSLLYRDPQNYVELLNGQFAEVAMRPRSTSAAKLTNKTSQGVRR